MAKTYAPVLYVVAASLAFVGDSFAEPLDIEAYDITAKPRPGPVEEFRPIKALPPVPFELPFDWGMDPFDDQSWQNTLHKLRPLVDSALAAGDFRYARGVQGLAAMARWPRGSWIVGRCGHRRSGGAVGVSAPCHRLARSVSDRVGRAACRKTKGFRLLFND